MIGPDIVREREPFQFRRLLVLRHPRLPNRHRVNFASQQSEAQTFGIGDLDNAHAGRVHVGIGQGAQQKQVRDAATRRQGNAAAGEFFKALNAALLYHDAASLERYAHDAGQGKFARNGNDAGSAEESDID